MRRHVSDSDREDAAETRRRLVETATAVFAERGFSEARTRDIAARTGVNIAMIAYHFTNKEGLYGAVITDIADRMAGPLAGVFATTRKALETSLPSGATWESLRTNLLVALHQVMRQEGIGNWSRIMLREQMDPSPSFAELQEKVCGPFITILADVLHRDALESGSRAEHSELLVRSFMLTGQLLVFTSAKASVDRMLAPADMARIEDLVRQV